MMHLVETENVIENGKEKEKENLEEKVIENEENLNKRREEEIESRKEHEKIEYRERWIFRARIQKEIFLREYTKKKKENMYVKWTNEKIFEKKMLWRQYREKEDVMDMDADERLDIIAKLMQKILERKPKIQKSDWLCENVSIRHGENATVVALVERCENDALNLCENALLHETTKLPKLGENDVMLHGENASNVNFNKGNNGLHSHKHNASANEILTINESEHRYDAVSKGKNFHR